MKSEKKRKVGKERRENTGGKRMVNREKRKQKKKAREGKRKERY